MNNSDDAPQESYRERLGTRLVIISTIALVTLGIFVMAGAVVTELRGNSPNAVRDAAQLLFSSLLPLLGTWVGTILAFYYSKENYEAASRGTLDAVRTVAQRLTSMPVIEAMMPKARMISLNLEAGKVIGDVQCQSVATKFQSIGGNGQSISRLPIFNERGVCLAFLHRGAWSEMLASALVADKTINLETTTLGALISQPYPLRAGITYNDFIQNAFAVVGRDASVADAKAAMERVQGCQDVVITDTGARTEPTVGWISNIDIGRLSKA